MNSEEKNKKIKVGYLSADFCDHPVGRFIYPIIREHSEKIDVTCFSAAKVNDCLTDSIKSLRVNWVDITKKTDIEIAREISKRSIDILVELCGYTADTRIRALTFKPAKIQMSYLGYFAPTYLKCIDGWIGDKILFDNLNTIQKDAHKLHYIDAGYMAYEMDENVKIKKTRREEFTFGCFNHSRKLTDETIELFSEILIKCKNSKLTLKSISFNERKEVENIEQKFEGYNIDRGD